MFFDSSFLRTLLSQALQESNGEYVDELQEQIDALHVAADQMQAQLKSAESRCVGRLSE